MKRYLERTSETLTEFWSIRLEGTTFTTSYGILGTEGLTNAISYTTLADAIQTFRTLTQEKVDQGYQQPEAPYRLITWKEFEQAFSPTFETPFGEFDELGEIRLYEADQGGNVTIRGDFALDYDKNAIVAGNLLVDGNIEMDTTQEQFLYVQGNVRADSILLSGSTSMHVQGNVELTHGIRGAYGEDGGFLEVIGSTNAQFILNMLYFTMHFFGPVTGIVINLSYPGLVADYDQDTFASAVVDELVKGEMLDEDKAYDYMRTGQNILKPSRKK